MKVSGGRYALGQVIIGVVEPVVLAEGAFEQADAAFQRQCRPFAHTVGFLGRGEVLDGEVEVFDDLRHHQVARVAALVELLFVRSQRTIHPGYVAVVFDLFEIEIGSEETGEALVLQAHVAILAVG